MKVIALKETQLGKHCVKKKRIFPQNKASIFHIQDCVVCQKEVAKHEK